MFTPSLRMAFACLLVGASVFTSSVSHSALVGRDLDGNHANGHEAVYDDVLGITWLADANLALSTTFGVAGISASGSMTWNTAESFIAAMNTHDSGQGYLGVNTWRQTTVLPLNGSSFDFTLTYDGSSDRGYQLSAPVDATYNQSGQSSGFTGSELAFHYYNNLSAIGACSGIGTDNTYGCVSPTIYGIENATHTVNLGLFSNIDSLNYWTGTEDDASRSFVFTYYGVQSSNLKTHDYLVWAVASGDFGTAIVPLPASVWLFLSAVTGLISLKRTVL